MGFPADENGSNRVDDAAAVRFLARVVISSLHVVESKHNIGYVLTLCTYRTCIYSMRYSRVSRLAVGARDVTWPVRIGACEGAPYLRGLGGL